jgi:hypothetical protein
MNKIADNIPVEILKKDYLFLKSAYKVAELHNVSATAVKRILKNAGVLRTQKLAALERDNSKSGKYDRTEEIKNKISKTKKEQYTSGEVKAPNKGKVFSEETRKKIGLKTKERVGQRNPNYKHGKYVRRPRDYKIHEFTKVRNFVFNRDGYKCVLTGKTGNLHAHHLIPYWVKPEAFLDSDNLITVSTEVHFNLCHKNDWTKFNVDIIPDSLIVKYSLNRERLNELASFKYKKDDAKV